MAELLIGLDVGTTATKALLFDLDGRLIASAGRGYGLLTPKPGWVEQDAEEMWRAAAEVLRSMARACPPGDRVAAIGLSSQGGTTVPVDAGFRAVGNAISWMDQRSGEEAKEVEARLGSEYVRRTTGWDLIGGLPLQHIGWLRRHCPADFAATGHFLFVNDFIGHRLTGRLCMNPTDASITQLMNLETGDWEERLLDAAGISREQLSPMAPSGVAIGPLTDLAAETTGLPRDTILVNGAHDQYCAAVGTGVTRPGRMLLSCGTAWVLLVVPADLEQGLSSGMAVSRHAVEGRWGAIRSLGAIGSSVEWLVDNSWLPPTGAADARVSGAERQQVYASLNQAAAQIPPGAGGLLFLPVAGGHAATFGSARGGFIDLTLGHTRGHLVRAVMEGAAYELHWTLEELAAAGVRITELTMVGGAAKSPVWTKIVADIVGLPVTVPALPDAAGRGAAIMAGVGVGLFPDVESAFVTWGGSDTRLEPDESHRDVLEQRYGRYREVARLLR